MNKTRINKLVSSINKQIGYHTAQIAELENNKKELLEELNKDLVVIQLRVASKDYNIPLQTLHSWKDRGELATIKQGKYVMCNKDQVHHLAIEKGYYVER